MENTLEIALESKKDIHGTRYFTMNHITHVEFEGCFIEKKRITPLTEAKMWAKKNGYVFLKVIALTNKTKDRVYTL